MTRDTDDDNPPHRFNTSIDVSALTTVDLSQVEQRVQASLRDAMNRSSANLMEQVMSNGMARGGTVSGRFPSRTPNQSGYARVSLYDTYNVEVQYRDLGQGRGTAWAVLHRGEVHRTYDTEDQASTAADRLVNDLILRERNEQRINRSDFIADYSWDDAALTGEELRQRLSRDIRENYRPPGYKDIREWSDVDLKEAVQTGRMFELGQMDRRQVEGKYPGYDARDLSALARKEIKRRRPSTPPEPVKRKRRMLG